MRVYLLLTSMLSLSLSMSCGANHGAGSSNGELTQEYEIRGARTFMTVKASIFFRDENGNVSYPRRVEFNDAAMNNDYLDQSHMPHIGCPIEAKKNVVTMIGRDTPRPRNDGSAFSILASGFKAENKVAITAGDGTRQVFSIDFEPVEFESPESIVLSRSKDTVVKLKGQGTGKETSRDFIINQQGKTADKTLLVYDREKNLLTVPARAVIGLKKGTANLELVSGKGDTIGVRSSLPSSKRLSVNEFLSRARENTYLITYISFSCVQVVD